MYKNASASSEFERGRTCVAQYLSPLCWFSFVVRRRVCFAAPTVPLLFFKQYKMNRETIEVILQQNLYTIKEFVKLMFDTVVKDIDRLKHENSELKRSLEFTQDC